MYEPDESPSGRTSVRRWPVRSAPLLMVVATAVALIAQSALASPTMGQRAAAIGGAAHRDDPATPPDGMTWIEGVITDQAATGQDNVNVEAWANDASATAPAASALTYGGDPNDPASLHGFFLLEVPSDHAFVITFSTVNGQEDGDPFRMKKYGNGLPVMFRPASRAAGRIRDLGTIALARQGTVVSSTKASLGKGKVTPSKRATLKVKVASPYVSDVAGRIAVRVAGRRVVTKLSRSEHGTTTLRLPRLKHAGAFKVHATFLGSGTVKRSSAKAVKLHVHAHK
ncbi:hypothetical protein ACVW2K_003363 [Nocardioides sp. HB32]